MRKVDGTIVLSQNRGVHVQWSFSNRSPKPQDNRLTGADGIYKGI